jgi:hypothetical protein
MPVAPFARQTYRFTDDLSPGTEESSTPAYCISQPGESTRDDLLLSKLGVRGWGRLHYFRNSFSGSWGDGRERPLSPRAVEVFSSFLESADLPPACRLSIFLTDDGNLELAWRDDSGRAVQLEFGPRQSEVYVESEGVEEVFANEELDKVIARYFV